MHNSAGSLEEGNIWVAENDQEIVGFYAIMPERLKIGKETITCAQSVDTAVNPNYRRLGIFNKLAQNVYSDSKNRYKFIYGFPSKMACNGFLQMGWKGFHADEYVKFANDQLPDSFSSNSIYKLLGKVFLKTYRTSRISSISKEKQSESLEIQHINAFSEEIEDFWAIARLQYPIVMERNLNFLNWRFSKFFGDYEIYIGRSLEDGKIKGYAVLKKTKILDVDNVLEIVDLWALPGKESFVFDITKLAIEKSEKENYSLIHYRAPSWHKHSSILQKFGFLKINQYLKLFQMYQPWAIYYDYGNKQELPNFNHWLYTMADTDYA